MTDALPLWRGKNAFTEWTSDLDSYNARNRYTDYDFKLGQPLTYEVEGEHANFIVPVVLDLRHDGKPERFDGLVNVVLKEGRDSWKITAFIWTTKVTSQGCRQPPPAPSGQCLAGITWRHSRSRVRFSDNLEELCKAVQAGSLCA